MRWLKQLSHRLSEDRGATVVIVAVSLTALIGMAALAIDIGALYGERRQLQSGADAGALAVAEDCALGKPCTTGTATATAGTYASSNANDAAAGIESVELNTAAREVTVKTKTLDTSGSDVYKPFLAQVIGFNGTTVNAEATAVWGSPSGLTTLPLIISDCESGWYTGQGFGVPVEITFHHGTSVSTAPPCASGPAGQDLPGAFGWLEPDNPPSCEVTVQVGVLTTEVSTGNSVPCSKAQMESLIGTDVLIPFYDEHQGSGSNGKYRVVGFGAFHLTGYYLGGGMKEPSSIKCLDEDGNPSGSVRCIRGWFTRASVPEGEIGGPDRGVVVVKLTK
jgi:Flp pilus assembly protein TadG